MRGATRDGWGGAGQAWARAACQQSARTWRAPGGPPAPPAARRFQAAGRPPRPAHAHSSALDSSITRSARKLKMTTASPAGSVSGQQGCSGSVLFPAGRELATRGGS